MARVLPRKLSGLRDLFVRGVLDARQAGFGIERILVEAGDTLIVTRELFHLFPGDEVVDVFAIRRAAFVDQLEDTLGQKVSVGKHDIRRRRHACVLIGDQCVLDTVRLDEDIA